MSNRIDNVEIFAAGVWNGDLYENKDLDDMVSAFEETKGVFKPYLKLGHNDSQELVQADGLPAAGWIDRVYRVGETLFADFVDIPQKIFDLIGNKAYRKVSSEIYWNLTVNDKKYPYLLGAVALLGADTPAVTSLNDILSLYGLKKQSEIEVKLYEFENNIPREEEIMSKTETEIKLELDLKASKEAFEELNCDAQSYSQEASELKAQVEEMQKKIDGHEAQEAKLEKEAEAAKLEKFVTELVSEKLSTPAMKPYIAELLGAEKKEYTVSEKQYSKQDLVKEMLRLHSAADVNTEEGSEAGQETRHNNSDDAQNAKIEKYAEENNISYAKAYKALAAELSAK